MINTILSLALVVLMIYDLTQTREAFNRCQRIGLGLIGGGVLMRITIWWSPHSPFDQWAAAVTLTGMIMYHGGRSWRNFLHARANSRALKMAREHMQRRGG